MRRSLYAALFVCLCAPVCHAQSLTKAETTATVEATIKANGQHSITGPVLQTNLLNLLSISATWGQGNWTSNIQYLSGEIVTYNGALWIGNSPITGTAPGVTSGQWMLLSPSIGTGLAISGGALGINLANANTWSAPQTFPNASITNAELAHPYTTVNGVPCTLGSTCTITATAANALTFGTHLTGTSYNGSAAVTIGTDATSANTPSTLMARDGSGNVSVNTLTGAVTGHASLDLAVSSLGANVASALAINIGIAGSVATQSTISGTTSLGIGALQFNTTGINNTALGFNALFNNTTGSDNVAIGQHALYTSTTGSDSVAIGRNAGANMTGSTNVAIGSNALSSATSSDIVAVGVDALQNLTSGIANTAVGKQALQNDTTGGSNTAFGDGTGEKITTGQSNTLFGSEAGNLIITGSYNVGVGSNALQAENAGENIAIGNFAGSAVTGQGQIFIGYQAGVAATATDTSASPNIGIGVQALEAVTSGQDNIAIGSSTLAKIMTSNNSLAIGNRALGNMVDGGAFGGANMGIGVDAGGSITTGSENTIVGRGAYEPLTTGVQNVGLGVQAGQADVTSNYTVAIGTSSLGGLLSGDRNTGLGQGAGFETEGVNDAFAVTTGDHDTFLGASTTLHSASQYSHVTVIGANAAAAVDANNTITLGRSADSLYVPNLTTAGLATVGASGLIGSEAAITSAQCPVATLSANGCVKPDGTTITISGGVISAATGGSGNVTGTGTSVVGNIPKFNNTSTTGIVDSGVPYNAIPAPNVSYTAPGTGAVANTQAAKNAEFVSIAGYGAVSDLVQITGNTSITSGAAALTVSGASFTSGDVGKAIMVPGAGSAGAPLQTTISAFTSSTQVTLAANASTTLSAVSETVWYGTDNTTTLNHWLAACRGVATCYANAGSYGFTGNLSVSTGALIVGAGQGVSNFYNLNPANNAFVINTNSPVEMYDLSISSPNYVTGVVGANIYITGSTQNFGSIIRGVSTRGGLYGIDAINSSVLRIDAVDIENEYIGVALADNNAPGSGGYLISNSNIACSPSNPGNSFAALQINNAGNLALTNSILHFCQYSVAVSLNNTSIPIGDLFFQGNSFEQNTVGGMTFTQGATGAVTQTVTIHGNDFGGGSPTGIFLGDSTAGWLEDTVITGNVFYPDGGYGIHVTHSASLGGVRIGENIFAQGGGTTTGILIDSGAVGTSGDNVFRGLTTNVTNNASSTWTNSTN